jgi:hypothetical protein
LAQNLGDKTYLIGFGVDLTERKQLEAQLREAQRWMRLGAWPEAWL